ncbi:hypothetical protein ITP53_19220 [Nonomuraea sp. K274]|uniref:Uncharacterized protein n=1 Tax=Nonomuraea cypriaca TaxID=1187855 RepID=A0A931A7L4_9ACTN|nr:hypothetical protein [Nonomuraea cypriaca]MBF8187826.1 hypothetical protein [Nonomuraea cypriaca]
MTNVISRAETEGMNRSGVVLSRGEMVSRPAQPWHSKASVIRPRQAESASTRTTGVFCREPTG